MNRIALIIALIVLSSCVSRYQDISRNLGYTHLFNTSYATKEEMYISGVNMPSGYGKDIDVYIIGPTNPSWTGPEVITRDILKKGTTLTIQSVRKCTNKIIEALNEQPYHTCCRRRSCNQETS